MEISKRAPPSKRRCINKTAHERQRKKVAVKGKKIPCALTLSTKHIDVSDR